MLVVVFSLGWVTGLVLHDKKLPDLGSVGAYVALVCGSLYAINRGATVMEHRSQSGQNGNQV